MCLKLNRDAENWDSKSEQSRFTDLHKVPTKTQTKPAYHPDPNDDPNENIK